MAYVNVVGVTPRVAEAIENGGPLVVTQEEFDAIDAAGLIHDDDTVGTIEVVVG